MAPLYWHVIASCFVEAPEKVGADPLTHVTVGLKVGKGAGPDDP